MPDKVISFEVCKEDGSKALTSTKVRKEHLSRNKAENSFLALALNAKNNRNIKSSCN